MKTWRLHSIFLPSSYYNLEDSKVKKHLFGKESLTHKQNLNVQFTVISTLVQTLLVIN